MLDHGYFESVEKSVLSSMIFDPSTCKIVFSRLDSNDLSHHSHKFIFDSIKELYNEQKPIDEELIYRKIKAKSLNINEDDIMQIISSNPLVDLDFYIDELKDRALKREIELTISKAKERLLDDEVRANDVLSLIALYTDEIKKRGRKRLLDIEHLDEVHEREPEFIVKSWLPFPKKTVSFITAPGGTGKSYLMLQLAMRFLLEAKESRAFLWFSEDPKSFTKHRAQKILDEILHESWDLIKSRLDISDSQTFHILKENHKRSFEVNPDFYELVDILEPYDLIVLDPLISFYGGDENNNAQARQFMQLFTQWASERDKTIIFIHHSTKGTTQSRGAGAFLDAVRLSYELERPKDRAGDVDEDSRELEIKITLKDNYGAKRILGATKVRRVIFPSHAKSLNATPRLIKRSKHKFGNSELDIEFAPRN